LSLCVDWDKWAHDCRNEYAEIEFENQIYLYR
jgi:hypothetical protein